MKPLTIARFDATGTAAGVAVALTGRHGGVGIVSRSPAGEVRFHRVHITDTLRGARLGAIVLGGAYGLVSTVFFATAIALGLWSHGLGLAIFDSLLAWVSYTAFGAAVGLILGGLRAMSAGLDSNRLRAMAGTLPPGRSLLVVATPASQADRLEALLREQGAYEVEHVPAAVVALG